MKKVKDLASKLYQTYIRNPQGEFFPQRPKSEKEEREWSIALAQDVVKNPSVAAMVAPQASLQGHAGYIDSRIWHQKAIEEAAKRNDWSQVKEIIDKMPYSDPYRKSMVNLFGSREMAEQIMDKPTRLEKLVDLAGRSPSFRTFLKKALQQRFTKEIANPHSVGFSSLEELYSTAKGVPMVESVRRTLGGIPTIY